MHKNNKQIRMKYDHFMAISDNTVEQRRNLKNRWKVYPQVIRKLNYNVIIVREAFKFPRKFSAKFCIFVKNLRMSIFK